MDLFEQVEKTKIYKQWIHDSQAKQIGNVYFRYHNIDIEDGEEYLVIFQNDETIRYFIEIISDTYFMIEISAPQFQELICKQKSWFFPFLYLAPTTLNELKALNLFEHSLAVK